MPDMNPKRKRPDQPVPGIPAPEPAVLESRHLLGEGAEVLIRHEGRIYRLRRTRLGKLILTA